MSESEDVIERDGCVLFWGGWPSQWHPATFVFDGVTYNCAEQYMMAEKALLFGDTVRREKILLSDSPKGQKEHGRRVTPFDPVRWDAVCREVVYRGNLAKFSQNAELRMLLLATGDRRIVEASPEDDIWGIGLGAEDPRASDPKQWLGTNWLGEAIQRVRAELLSV